LPQDVKRNQSVGIVESVKNVSDIYSPVVGKITAVNEALLENPGFISSEPLGGALDDKRLQSCRSGEA
jgi:glycine cleavage system H protein